MEPKEKKAFEPSGLVPRSIVRTFERFRQQLLPGSETAAIREYRISRYQVLVSARCLFTLLTIPIATNWLVSSWILSPLIQHFWNTQQNEIFLNSYQEERAFAELEFFSEKIFFESLLNKTGTFAIQSQPSFWESPVYTPKGTFPLKCVLDSVRTDCACQLREPCTFCVSYLRYRRSTALYECPVLLPTETGSGYAQHTKDIRIVGHQRYGNDNGYFSTNPTSMLPCSFAVKSPSININHIPKQPLFPSNYWLCKPVDETQRKKQALRSLLSICYVPLAYSSSISYPCDYFSVTDEYAQGLQNSEEYSRELLQRLPRTVRTKYSTYRASYLRDGSEAGSTDTLPPACCTDPLPPTSQAVLRTYRGRSTGHPTVRSTGMEAVLLPTETQEVQYAQLPTDAPSGRSELAGYAVPALFTMDAFYSYPCPYEVQLAKLGVRGQYNTHSTVRCHGLKNTALLNQKYQANSLGLEIDSAKIKEKVQEKILELAIYYNQQTILSITNVVGDLVSIFTLGCLFVWMKPEIAILKSFLIEAIYSLSDTTKSFLLILLTDLLVGFHSPRGWETALELLLKHFGLPENQDFVFLFVATFPVLLDTVFKYWIFRHLNKISPSTVATYHSMIE